MPLLKQMLLLEKSMTLLPTAIQLNLSAYPLRIYTNSPALINFLKDYFSGWITKINRDAPWPKEQVSKSTNPTASTISLIKPHGATGSGMAAKRRIKRRY